MDIRPLNAAEVPLFCEMATQAFTETYRGKIFDHDMAQFTSEMFAPSAVIKSLETAKIQVVWCDGVMAGYIWLEPQPVPVEGFSAERPLYLRRLYFLPNYTGKGYGRALLEQAITFAERKSYTHLWLTVWDENPRAEAFYQRESFQTIGDCTFPVGSLMCRDWVMVRQLRNGSAVPMLI